jgi:hypothetical protein
MKFKLSTIGDCYTDPDKIEKLEKIGFTFKPSTFAMFNTKTFHIEGSPEIEINTLEELIEFSNTFGELIVSDGSIEIYDDYR